MGCMTDSDEHEHEVCEDVKTSNGYCFIPLATNEDVLSTQCNFNNYSSCDYHADPDGDGRVTGTCQAQYIYVRECN